MLVEYDTKKKNSSQPASPRKPEANKTPFNTKVKMSQRTLWLSTGQPHTKRQAMHC
jgi:hypothetical protein